MTEDRFWAKVDKSDDCWAWTAARTPDGYGWFLYKRRSRIAHRVAYMLTVGDIPDGLELDHLCRNRACVRPDHLEPVTHAENVRRGGPAMATHCKRGHEFTPENTLRNGANRLCRTCRTASERKRVYNRTTNQATTRSRYYELREAGYGSRAARWASKSDARFRDSMLRRAAEALEEAIR